MKRRFQFSLKTVLTTMLLIAAVGVPFDYLLRIPVVVPVAGTVMLDGAPLSGAQISFSGDGHGGGCRTDAAGKFAIPLLPGSYKVLVIKTIPTGPLRYAHSGELLDPTKDWIGAVVQPSRSLIPGRYSDWSVSPLTAHVREGAANRFVFELVTP